MTCRILQNNDEKHRDMKNTMEKNNNNKKTNKQTKKNSTAEKKQWETNLHLEELQILTDQLS